MQVKGRSDSKEEILRTSTCIRRDFLN